jgi:hypothetical protein
MLKCVMYVIFDDAVNWDKKNGCFSNVMLLIQWQGSGKISCFRKILKARGPFGLFVTSQLSNELL